SPIPNSSSSIRLPSTSAAIPRRWRRKRCAAKARSSSTRPAGASCRRSIPMPSWRHATSSPAPSIARSPPATKCISTARRRSVRRSRSAFRPFTPAAHYHMGGVASDAWARSSLAGLWVVGECAATGLHGANRLASNSLLEAIVFGARAAADIAGSVSSRPGAGNPPAPERFASPAPPHVLRDAMTRCAGLERDAAGLRQVISVIDQVERAGGREPALLNMTSTAKLIATAALVRQESRGGHYRTDYPATGADAKRTFMTL